MSDTYEKDMTSRTNDRNLILLGVRADADINFRDKKIQQLKQELERCKEMTITQPLLGKLINVLGEISEDTDATTAVSIASVRLVRYEQELELYREVIEAAKEMWDSISSINYLNDDDSKGDAFIQALSKLNSQQGGSDDV